jgi:hypothetical protein
VTIVFAARVSMKPLAALLEMKPGPQAQKAEAALRVLDVVLREVASSRYNEYISFFSTYKDLHHKLPKGGYNVIVLEYVYPSYVNFLLLIV